MGMTAASVFLGGGNTNALSTLFPFMSSSTTTALSGVPDGKQFLLSFWVKFDSGSTSLFDTISSRTAPATTATESTFSRLVYVPSNTKRYLSFNVRNAASAQVLAGNTASISGGEITADAWHHIALSVDMTDPAKRKLIIDDVEVTASYAAYNNDTFDLSRAYYVMGFYSTYTPAGALNVSVAHLVFDNNYFDVVANKRNFITADGTPVDGGANGSVFTGSQPLVYHRGGAVNFPVNRGSIAYNLSITGTPVDGERPEL